MNDVRWIQMSTVKKETKVNHVRTFAKYNNKALKTKKTFMEK